MKRKENKEKTPVSDRAQGKPGERLVLTAEEMNWIVGGAAIDQGAGRDHWGIGWPPPITG
jgi:hypothetical protein